MKVFYFGRPWPECDEDEDIAKGEFPDMSDVQNVTLGPRSGLIVVTTR